MKPRTRNLAAILHHAEKPRPADTAVSNGGKGSGHGIFVGTEKIGLFCDNKISGHKQT